MTTPATRTVSSDMHWAAWLSLILAVLGLWLLVEIATFSVKTPSDQTRYPVSQHDFLAKTPPPEKVAPVETESTSEETISVAVDPETAEKTDKNLEDETNAFSTEQPEGEVLPDSDEKPDTDIAGEMSAHPSTPPEGEVLPDTDSEPPLPTVEDDGTLKTETTVAMIDPEPPVDMNVTESTEFQASLPDTDTMIETPADTAARYVTVWTGNIRREPDNQSAALFQLRWGQKVKVLGDQGRWNQIETSDGQRGWGHKTLFADTPPSLDQIEGLKGVVETIRVQMDGARACTIFIDLDGNQPPQTQVLEGEAPRLVSDFSLMMADPKIAPTISVHNGVVNAIRVGITNQDSLTTRVVVDLIPGIDYVVDQVFYQEEQTYALHIKAKEV